ncbi:hypothetical protein [Candidatus Xianfuyuplasma coldseepsis]|uniref:Uncharacterized protein n=1 Tax=Candidatus Xianfuyuplasma coldseepsis TaxID=2782163 RepID=A0A7L7KRE9_9MOLU|nr:hypothetical protein [Xianfuyuplasma coldseepsis]QMS85277.1 hypothetical protein G4Z02_05775 [Xianfuyuplasma coldseepsis]
MKRQDYFRLSAIISMLLLITMYSYFWYSAGVVGFSYAFKHVLWGIAILIIFALSTVSASKSPYLEKKHSLIFSGISLTPIILYIIAYLLSGEILDFAVGFAYTMFAILILCALSYILSIFAKD